MNLKWVYEFLTRTSRVTQSWIDRRTGAISGSAGGQDVKGTFDMRSEETNRQ